MDKKIMAVWFLLFSVMFVLLIEGVSSVKKISYSRTQNTKVRELTEWQQRISDKRDENGNYTVSYSIKVPLIHNGGETLMFYSYHSDVDAYIDGQRVYGVSILSKEDSFKAVTPKRWNKFVVMKEDEGKTLRIVMKTPYKSALNYVPQFELGRDLDIIVKQLKDSLISILLSAVIFACGFYMAVYSGITGKSTRRSCHIVYLGIFSMFIGIWFLINIPIVNFLTGRGPQMEYFSYLLFGMLPVPFALFEKQIVDKKFRWVLNVLIGVILAAQAFCVGLQLAGIKDMKESQMLIHIVMILFIFVFIILALINIQNKSSEVAGRLNRVNLLYAVITSVGVGGDMFAYYTRTTGVQSFVLTKILLLLYIITLAGITMRETEALVKKAEKAEEFQTLAYKDELTGVYSRTAYTEDIAGMNPAGSPYIVCMFDLNNLKQCNDTMGHACGDRYIKQSAEMIEESFAQLGKCYRIGGDEFCVISATDDSGQIAQACARLANRINHYNEENTGMKIGIAVGYAAYDPACDGTIEDTRNRADQLMYENKKQLKEKEYKK